MAGTGAGSETGTPERPSDHDVDLTGTSTQYGYVERIAKDVATVLIGDDFEEWTFPTHVLPPDVHEESFVLIEGTGRDLTVIGVAHSVPSLESRLGRDLNRRRPIVTPLPHRDHHEAEGEELTIDKRVSRYARDLGH